jgi:hypothetical protein
MLPVNRVDVDAVLGPPSKEMSVRHSDFRSISAVLKPYRQEIPPTIDRSIGGRAILPAAGFQPALAA